MSIEKTIYEAMQNLSANLSREVEEKGFVDTGAARKFDIEIRGNKIQLWGVGYFGVLVNGRAPGKFPPPDKILEYVHRNNIQIEIDGRLLNDRQAAYVIGRSIALNGSLIYRGEKEGVDLENIVGDWEKDMLKKVGDEAVKNVMTELKI